MKRQANVLSALIQNFDTVEEVIEASANSAGSALEENERWLDSIQGKIDQFNNAVQALWQNLLGSDVIKGIVEWGTKIIKSLDTTKGKILAIVKAVALLMAYKKVNPFEWITNIKQFWSMFSGKGLKGSITIIKQYLASIIGIGPAMKTMTAETIANTLATAVNDDAKTKAALTSMGFASSTEMLTLAQRKQALETLIAKQSINGLTNAEIAAIAASWGLKTSIDATNGSIKVVDTTTKSFMATNPVGWILLIVSAVAALIMWLSQIPSKIEKLTEKLNNLKSELRDIQSELDSVNSELEITQDRLSELLAKDKLTFTEKEELNNLKKQNDELQRRLDLLELQNKNKLSQAAQTFISTMKTDMQDDDEYFYEIDPTANVKNGFWQSISRAISKMTMKYESEADMLDRRLELYQQYTQELSEIEQKILDVGGEDTEEGKELAQQRQTKKNKMAEIESYMDGKVLEWNTHAEGLDYGINEEADEWLDYIKNYEDKWAIMQGGNNAKTNALSRIFNKDENASLKESIDGYVEDLKKGDISAKKHIDEIIRNNSELVADIEASGMKIDDAVEYFTSFASEANYTTIEGKVKEIDEATKRLKTSFSGFDTSNLDAVKQALTNKGWVDAEGNLMSDVIAEYFGGENGGISAKTQEEIERLVQQIYDGKMSVEDALKSFKLFGVQSVIDLQIAEVKTNFNDIFVDLEDADGLIDTFEELGSAINSTVGALEAFNQAQADVADKGFVSIQTALQLMEYTDDYGSVLQVVDGKLQLAENAEENLIQARLEAIRVSAHAAVADAQAAYDKADLAVKSYRAAMVEEASASTVATAWQKIVAVAAGIKNALDNIWSGESIGDLYNSGYESYLTSATGYEMKYDDTNLQALEDALADSKKKLDETKDNAEIADHIADNPDSLEDVFKSSDKSDPKEVAEDAFQKEMDYWENRLSANQARADRLQNEIDLLEQKGMKASAQYYKDQMTLLNSVDPEDGFDSKLELLNGKLAAVVTRLGQVTEGSEEYWEAAQEYNDIVNEIQEIESALVDLQDAIGEIDTYKFEEFNTRLDNLTSKLETIRNLIAPDGEEDWFADDGSWTDEGIASLATYIQELEHYRIGYANTMAELGKYAESYEGNEDYYAELGIQSEQNYYDKVEELTDQQYQFAESISDTEQSVVDMYESSIDAIEEYVDTLIDGYNDYIDSVKEALDAERDLYDFKKNVQKQAKDIAALERRIASLSGSTNKSDVAERRKLEAQLYESRESLNDTYYDHAKEAQQNALDAEREAYEETMTLMIEGMRTSLEEATADMDTFLNNVTIAVSMNADTVLAKYRETNVYLDPALTNPWENAKVAAGQYAGDANNLMDVWKQGGYFAKFKSTASINLSSPWNSGTTAANTFRSSVYTVMSNVVSNIATNVKTASGELSKLYQQIQDTEKRAASANVSVGGGSSSGGYSGGSSGTSQSTTTTPKQLDNAILNKYKLTSAQVLALGYGPISLSEFENLLRNYQIKYSSLYRQVANTRDIERLSKKVMYGEYVSGPLAIRQYAKGTMGTTHDGWAITDEPQFGDELVLVPGKDGNLSFMRKGTGVVPADLTANLMEWGQFTPDSMNLGGGINVNMINNAVNKPEFNFAFDALVKAENITEETLPAVKKLVTQELNRFTKELNYALKGKGAR